MSFILTAALVLGAIALVSAVVLFAASKKFAVKEDQRIAQAQELLPGANCGGCGFPGCSAMAEALVKGADAGSLEGLFCPVGGQAVMGQVADLLGMAVANSEPKVAVVRCNGTCELRAKTIQYDGLRTCKAMNTCGAGETGCGYGCLGCGDCVEACQFDAIHINPETGIAEVDEEKCIACGACAKACPRNIIELRKRGPKNRRVYVSCVNKDKGAVAKKACNAACIGCGKCEKVCQFEAIKVENNVSYIDYNKCRMCLKCVEACPTHAIHAVNFPVRKKVEPKTVEPKAASEQTSAAEVNTEKKEENV
jgi:Na+-translocating ferredoxin:NAD+ oxidoreductase RNF subunit RnfB